MLLHCVRNSNIRVAAIWGGSEQPSIRACGLLNFIIHHIMGPILGGGEQGLLCLVTGFMFIRVMVSLEMLHCGS